MHCKAINRRDFLRSIGAGAAALAMQGCAGMGPAPSPEHGIKTRTAKPNILLITTDQHRFDALSCYGCEAVDTPNIDRLATEGTLFEKCYSPCPVCTPSRSSMFTGKPVSGHGVYKLHDILPDDQVLFTKRLQSVGYQTSLVGKLHVSGLWHEDKERHPNDGFDNYEWCIDPGLNFDSEYNAFARWVARKDPEFYKRLKKEGKSLHHFPAHLHFSRWASETTMDLIESRDKDKPFFLIMSLFDPHDPYFDHPIEAADLVKAANIPKPQPVPEDKDRPDGVRREMAKSQSIKETSQTFKGSIHDFKKGYYASIAFFDAEIGKVLDFLDRRGLTENTLVIFVSDHGDMLWDRGLFTKGAFFYDASVRVPFVMRLPGRIKPGTRVKGPVQQIDIAATSLALAGFGQEELQQIMPESMDLLALIKQGKTYENYRDYAVCTYRNTGYGPGHKYFDPPIHGTMFLDDRFKLNVYHSCSDEGKLQGELYDMDNDPQEVNNLWADAQYSEVKMKLMQRLMDWMVENNIRDFGSRGGEKFRTLKKSYYGPQK